MRAEVRNLHGGLWCRLHTFTLNSGWTYSALTRNRRYVKIKRSWNVPLLYGQRICSNWYLRIFTKEQKRFYLLIKHLSYSYGEKIFSILSTESCVNSVAFIDICDDSGNYFSEPFIFSNTFSTKPHSKLLFMYSNYWTVSMAC